MSSGEQTRQAIFEATLELVAEKGFAATTVDDIAEHAGVAKGTVYYHFNSKAELVEALIVQRLAPLSDRFLEAVGVSLDPDEQLRSIVCAMLEFIRTDHAFAKVLVVEMWREDRVWRSTVTALRDDALDVLRDVIDAGIALGEFTVEVDSAMSATALFAMVSSVGISGLIEEPHEHSYAELTLSLQRLAVGMMRKV